MGTKLHAREPRHQISCPHTHLSVYFAIFWKTGEMANAKKRRRKKELDSPQTFEANKNVDFWYLVIVQYICNCTSIFSFLERYTVF